MKPAKLFFLLLFLGGTRGWAELSGPHWVERFPGSRSTADLREPFRAQVEAFLAALGDGGATVAIFSTYRPPERQHLMHWAWRIARERYLDSQEPVPAMAGVDIQWLWTDPQQRPLRGESVEAADRMVNAYGLRFRPAPTSRHAQRRAIDMGITWAATLRILDRDGQLQELAEPPRTGRNPALHAIGASYGVYKLVADSPHWSDDGH